MTRILTQTIALFVFFTHMASVQLVAEDGHPAIDLNRGWVALLKDKNLSGWQFLDMKRGSTAPRNTWKLDDNGVLTRRGKAYIATTKEYGDFILDLEFKVGKHANSGIFLRYDPKYSAGTRSYWWNGALEIQLLDSYGKASVGKHDCAALYDMAAPSQNAARPPGQWNRITITAQGSHITVVLNSAKVVDVDLDDWSEPNKNPDGTPNKYKKPMKDAPRRGLIVLQEHPGDIWFRNIFIRSLE